jgi:hypothetical protein
VKECPTPCSSGETLPASRQPPNRLVDASWHVPSRSGRAPVNSTHYRRKQLFPKSLPADKEMLASANRPGYCGSPTAVGLLLGGGEVAGIGCPGGVVVHG